MKKRPLPVTVIGCIYIAAGAIGLAFHFTDFKPQHPFSNEIVWVSLIRLIAIVCGVFILRGSNWARWLALAWIVYHVVLSAFHSRFELLVHTLLCVVIAYFLLHPQATQYFCSARTKGQ